MYLINANFGNDSIALIKWAADNQLSNVYVVSVDTGWQSPCWSGRVLQAKDWVQKLGFSFVRLQSKVSFPELVMTKKEFPSKKFQWCSSFLKGSTILDWLDKSGLEFDTEAVILLAHRRSAARGLQNLSEYIEESEYYGDRKIWHPMYLHSDKDMRTMVFDAGFKVLEHRSLECDPCINSIPSELPYMYPEALDKAGLLEKNIGSCMLDQSLFPGVDNIAAAKAQVLGREDELKDNYYESFLSGCSSAYGCGL